MNPLGNRQLQEHGSDVDFARMSAAPDSQSGRKEIACGILKELEALETIILTPGCALVFEEALAHFVIVKSSVLQLARETIPSIDVSVSQHVLNLQNELSKIRDGRGRGMGDDINELVFQKTCDARKHYPALLAINAFLVSYAPSEARK